MKAIPGWRFCAASPCIKPRHLQKIRLCRFVLRLGIILNRVISFKHSGLPEKENTMAVQQNKKSRSRKGMRRSHDRVATPAVIYCPNCGAYKGRQVIAKTEVE